MNATELTTGKSVIVNANGKQFIGIVESYGSDFVGVIIAYSPDLGKTRETDLGHLYTVIVAYPSEVLENKTGLSLKISGNLK